MKGNLRKDFREIMAVSNIRLFANLAALNIRWRNREIEHAEGLTDAYEIILANERIARHNGKAAAFIFCAKELARQFKVVAI